MRLMTCAIVVLLAASFGPMRPADPQTSLTGYSVLPADTFAEGPASGAFLRGGVRGSRPPFRSQPVQGFSSLWPSEDGAWWALVDNGYGSRLNSPDFLLRIYKITPHFDDRSGVEVAPAFVSLRDPARRVPFHIGHDDTANRLLTGADFDPESMVRVSDGSFWIGEEFGPYLLHIAADGTLLEAPFEANGMRSPDNPLVLPPDAGKTSAATVGRSCGFEGLALAPGDRLIALLERGTLEDAGRHSRAFEFDLRTRQFTGRQWLVPFDADAHSFTELVHYDNDQYLVIERDNLQGAEARFKRVFVVTFSANPVASKRLLADLLAIQDPDHRAGTGTLFTFPFITPEALWPVDRQTLVIVNDNNYPSTGGRGPDKRDDSEFIRVTIP